MVTKRNYLKRNKKTRKKYQKTRKTRKIRKIKKLKFKNLGKTKRKNKKIQYGYSVKKMKGGDATLNLLSNTSNTISNSIESVYSTLYGENNNSFTSYNDYP